MKTNLDKYVEEVIAGFQENKGRASVYCFPPIDYTEVIIRLIDQFYTRTPGAQVLIVVDGFNTRQAINNRIIKSDKEYNVKILTDSFIQSKYKYEYRLIITIGVNDNLELLTYLSTQGKFLLTILTKNIMDNEFILNLRHLLPAIEVTISNNAIRGDSIYSPVEEHRVAIDLSKDDRELYDKQCEYISTCVQVFGDISNIEKCRIGDPSLNISAAEYRDSIAKENGWNLELDTSIDWNKEIDDVYNPNVLLERANNFYNITKARKDLVTDNIGKLAQIYKICFDYLGKKILIVSKRGDFAAIVTKYLNECETFECVDYHDNMDKQPAYDMYGQSILIKSGKDKGKPKLLGSQAASTLNMSRFNNSEVNVMSIKNASNVKLEIAVDLVIFTSPYVDDIIAFKTRFNNVKFNGIPTINYKIYCRSTIENKLLIDQKENNLITIVDNNDNFVTFDETSW